MRRRCLARGFDELVNFVHLRLVSSMADSPKNITLTILRYLGLAPGTKLLVARIQFSFSLFVIFSPLPDQTLSPWYYSLFSDFFTPKKYSECSLRLLRGSHLHLLLCMTWPLGVGLWPLVLNRHASHDLIKDLDGSIISSIHYLALANGSGSSAMVRRSNISRTRPPRIALPRFRSRNKIFDMGQTSTRSSWCQHTVSMLAVCCQHAVKCYQILSRSLMRSKHAVDSKA